MLTPAPPLPPPKGRHPAGQGGRGDGAAGGRRDAQARAREGGWGWPRSRQHWRPACPPPSRAPLFIPSRARPTLHALSASPPGASCGWKLRGTWCRRATTPAPAVAVATRRSTSPRSWRCCGKQVGGVGRGGAAAGPVSSASLGQGPRAGFRPRRCCPTPTSATRALAAPTPPPSPPGGLLRIEDVLPLFPDFVTIDAFKVRPRAGPARLECLRFPAWPRRGHLGPRQRTGRQAPQPAPRPSFSPLTAPSNSTPPPQAAIVDSLQRYSAQSRSPPPTPSSPAPAPAHPHPPRPPSSTACSATARRAAPHHPPLSPRPRPPRPPRPPSSTACSATARRSKTSSGTWTRPRRSRVGGAGAPGRAGRGGRRRRGMRLGRRRQRQLPPGVDHRSLLPASRPAPTGGPSHPPAEAIRTDLSRISGRTATVSGRQPCARCGRPLVAAPPNAGRLPAGGAVPQFYVYPTGGAAPGVCARALCLHSARAC
jgi:hypothetical protein